MNAVTDVAAEPSSFMAKLPALLRILGAAALVVAMYGFLVRGWQTGNDVSRYLMLLGHTGVLATIGLASGHWLKEAKGARLLLTMALVSVPANFAILGAFIYGHSSGAELAYYPQYVSWTTASLSTALFTSGTALAVLVPVTVLGFRVLARSMSRTLAGLFLLSNLALLIPLRDPAAVAVLVTGLTIGVLLACRRTAMHQTVAHTREGITALGLQMLPLAVLLGRTLWLYAFDLFLATVLAGTLYVTLRQISLMLRQGSLPRHVLDALALLPSLWLLILLPMTLAEMNLLPDAWIIPTIVLVCGGLIYDIAQRSAAYALRYRVLALAVVLLGVIGNLLLVSSTLAALAAVFAGIAVLTLGYRTKQLSVLVGGAVLLIAGVVHQLIDLIRHFDLGSWMSLAILGIVAIVVASVLESRSTVLRERIIAWRGQLKAWERS